MLSLLPSQLASKRALSTLPQSDAPLYKYPRPMPAYYFVFRAHSSVYYLAIALHKPPSPSASSSIAPTTSLFLHDSICPSLISSTRRCSSQRKILIVSRSSSAHSGRPIAEPNPRQSACVAYDASSQPTLIEPDLARLASMI